MNNTEALMVLNAVKGLGCVTIRKLIEYYGSAVKVLVLNESALLSHSVVPVSVIKSIINFPKADFLKSEYALMAKRNARTITWLDKDYPQMLRETEGSPCILYVKGDLPSEKSLAVAIVGSRKASFYGLSNAYKFASRLSELGITVVSGMARGIDAEAHKGALKTGGKTIAVLGCGLSHVYPLENKDLFEKIAVSGAVISEFPMNTPPLPYNFPRRNRIISGLSLGVIVVEAAQRSGALITADFALEQGREVFAVPGKIDSMTAQGAHRLIKQGAKLMTCIEDVLEDIQQKCSAYVHSDTSACEDNSSSSTNRMSENAPKKLSNEEKVVFDQITDRPVHIDELIDKCGTAVPVMAVLLQLELKHMIKQLPGKLFIHQLTI